MSDRLRILHLEDDPDYSKLAQDLLSRGSVEADVKLVSNQADFEAAIGDGKYDVILADYLLPYYTGLRALAVAKERVPHTPFLLVSGTIGEQAAIESLQSGATDYVLKQWPERLVPAVQRAVREARERERLRKAEDELMRREKYFRALTENALDVLTILDLEGNFIYNSQSINRVLGYDPGELAGKCAFNYVHPDDVQRVLKTFQYAVEHPDQQLIETFRFKRGDGSWCYLEVMGQNRADDPDIAGVVINTRDISDRKRAEQVLRESEKEYRLLFHGNPNPMWVFDIETLEFLEVNEAAIEHYGYSREEFLSMKLGNIRAVESLVRSVEIADRAIKKEIESAERRECVWRQKKKSGEVIDVAVKWSPLAFQGRLAALALGNDVTAQKRLEEQFRQAQKMEAIGQLAGGVAHDFNNILTVINGHASLLMASGELSPAATKSAQQVVQAAGRAASLTRQLLTFSRRQMMEPRRLDLNEAVGNMTKMLDRILGEHVSLEVHYSPHPAFVQADAGMMEQVVLNLAVNGRDAMPKGGKLNVIISMIELRARDLEQRPEARAGRFAMLTMADSGHGIEPETMRRIFEPFFTTKEVGKGTGLGLATVYGIVKQHQGWVEVESEVGKGTTFFVFIPASSDVSESSEEKPTDIIVRGGTETILVVEDEEPVRTLVGSILRGHGYQVLDAETGAKALSVWADHKNSINLLLTDLVMPDRMNGRELAEKLRADRPELRVIFTSGYSADVVGKEFVLQPGLNYLQKPYHPQTLALTVRDCLDTRIPVRQGQ
jgi:PAS domain S-box-containing protein